jgi:hypothetical protein
LTGGADLRVVINESALEELGDYVQRRHRPEVLVVMDRNTEAAAGRAAVELLRMRGLLVSELVFPQRSALYPDGASIALVQRRIAGDVRPVAVGAGVITDIVRYASHSRGRDFVSVATAASMDGYASTVAALQFDGVKSRCPPGLRGPCSPTPGCWRRRRSNSPAPVPATSWPRPALASIGWHRTCSVARSSRPQRPPWSTPRSPTRCRTPVPSPPASRRRSPFHFASRLRSRYTTIDFLEGQGQLDRAVHAMLAGGREGP